MKYQYHIRKSHFLWGDMVSSTFGDSMFERCTASMKPKYLWPSGKSWLKRLKSPPGKLPDA